MLGSVHRCRHKEGISLLGLACWRPLGRTMWLPIPVCRLMDVSPRSARTSRPLVGFQRNLRTNSHLWDRSLLLTKGHTSREGCDGMTFVYLHYAAALLQRCAPSGLETQRDHHFIPWTRYIPVRRWSADPRDGWLVEDPRSGRLRSAESDKVRVVIHLGSRWPEQPERG